VAEALAGGREPPEEDPEAAFERQAAATGLVLPKRAHRDPWTALAIVVTVILVTAGLGEVTGWVNLRESPPAWSYTNLSCTGNAPVHAAGTVTAGLGPAYVQWLDSVAQSMAKTVGQCFSLDLSTTTGTGYSPPLGGMGSEFTATYALPSAAEVNTFPYPVVTVPVSLNAVAVVYNAPGVPSGLNLTADDLAGIYNGSITAWDSPAILATNPSSDLPSAPSILPYHDANASAATDAFTSFLSAASPSWGSEVGAGSSVAWPVGPAVASDAAMLAAVAATPGSIGYLEIYGVPPAGVGVANLQDRAGDFAGPTDVDTWVAAQSLGNSSAVASADWSALALYSAPAAESYPLAVLSYVGLYADLGIAYAGALSLTNASWLLGYVYWLTAEVSVAPMPTAYETAAVNALNNETFDGAKIMNLENEATEGAEGGETGEF
jgi:phosphate transport system substrate-binding protein